MIKKSFMLVLNIIKNLRIFELLAVKIMKSAKNDISRSFKPKVIAMKLKNQPALMFDPASP